MAVGRKSEVGGMLDVCDWFYFRAKSTDRNESVSLKRATSNTKLVSQASSLVGRGGPWTVDHATEAPRY